MASHTMCFNPFCSRSIPISIHLRFHEICMNQSITICNMQYLMNIFRIKILTKKVRMLIQKEFSPLRAQFYSEHGFKFILKVFTRYLLNQFGPYILRIVSSKITFVQFHIKMRSLLQKLFWTNVLPNIILKVSLCSKIAEDFFI